MQRGRAEPLLLPVGARCSRVQLIYRVAVSSQIIADVHSVSKMVMTDTQTTSADDTWPNSYQLCANITFSTTTFEFSFS
jgi:hypothetical protein